MKNITIAVPDEVYRAARVQAAKQHTSVSALVSDYLRRMSGPDGFAALEPEFGTFVIKIRERVDPHGGEDAPY